SWRGLRVARDGLNADPGVAKDMLRKNRFVHANLLVDRGRATFTYDGHTISGDLPGFGEGMVSGNFLFGGRTGGAHDNQWIDNLKINCFTQGAAVAVTDPANITVVEGETARFDVQVDGTPPLSFQWQVSNNGGAFTDIPGATYQSYTT